MEVRVLLPELLAPARRGWSLQTPEKRLLLHELARLVTPVVKRTITRASEARGLGSTPGWGNVTYGLAAASRGVAGWMSPARRGGLLVPPTCPRATAGLRRLSARRSLLSSGCAGQHTTVRRSRTRFDSWRGYCGARLPACPTHMPAGREWQRTAPVMRTV